MTDHKPAERVRRTADGGLTWAPIDADAAERASPAAHDIGADYRAMEALGIDPTASQDGDTCSRVVAVARAIREAFKCGIETGEMTRGAAERASPSDDPAFAFMETPGMARVLREEAPERASPSDALREALQAIHDKCQAAFLKNGHGFDLTLAISLTAAKALDVPVGDETRAAAQLRDEANDLDARATAYADARYDRKSAEWLPARDGYYQGASLRGASGAPLRDEPTRVVVATLVVCPGCGGERRLDSLGKIINWNRGVRCRSCRQPDQDEMRGASEPREASGALRDAYAAAAGRHALANHDLAASAVLSRTMEMDAWRALRKPILNRIEEAQREQEEARRELERAEALRRGAEPDPGAK